VTDPRPLSTASLTETTELDRSFELNGEKLPDTLLRKINRMYLMSAPRYRVGGYWFVFDWTGPTGQSGAPTHCK